MLRPINNRIVLRRLGDTTITPGGIVIPGNSQEKSQRAEVLAVGPGKWQLQCAHCRREHSRVEWSSLVLIGWFGSVFSRTLCRAIELRRCRCGERLGLEVHLPLGVA